MDEDKLKKPIFDGISVPSIINRGDQGKKECVGERVKLSKVNINDEIKARKSTFGMGKNGDENGESRSRGSSKINETRFDNNNLIKEDDLGNRNRGGLRNRLNVLPQNNSSPRKKNGYDDDEDDDGDDDDGDYGDDGDSDGDRGDEEDDEEDHNSRNVHFYNNNGFNNFEPSSIKNDNNNKSDYNNNYSDYNNNNKYKINNDVNNDNIKNITNLILPIIPLSNSSEDEEEEKGDDEGSIKANEKLSQDRQSNNSKLFGFIDTEEIIEYEEDFEESVGVCEDDLKSSYSDSEVEDDFEPVNKKVSMQEIADNVPEHVNTGLVKFYMEHFSTRTCKRFVLNPEDEEKENCFCGYIESQHNDLSTATISKSIIGKHYFKDKFQQNNKENNVKTENPKNIISNFNDKMNKNNFNSNKINSNNNIPNNISSNKPFLNGTSDKTDTTKAAETDNKMNLLSGEGTVKKRERPWDIKKDTKLYPTNAFGEIFFGEKENAKYLKLDEDTDTRKIIKLLTKMWQIEKPKLIISMKGGEGRYNFDNKKRKVFWEGLGKTSISANAWILTDGFNSGVSKEVGDALKHYYSRFGRKQKINCIGITPWGCVNNRELLTSETGYGSWPVQYITLPGEDKKDEWQICTRHSHFLFTDNGTQHTRGYQKAVRAKLERQVAALDASRNSNSLILPIVTIVLEGNLETLNDIAEDIDCLIPVILIAGSGGMTDIIAFAYHNCVVTEVKTKNNLDKFRSKLVSIYQEETFDKVKEMIEKMYECDDAKAHSETVRKIVENAGLLSVFRAEELSTQGDLDIVILKAVLKTKQMKRIEQLKLALMLNRVDVAREEIYTQDAAFETEDLNEVMFRALLEDNTGFVKLLLEKGINLDYFLSVKRLLDLYNHPITLKRNKYLYKVAKKSGLVSLKHVGGLIYEMTNENIRHIYMKAPYKNVVAQDYYPALTKRKDTKIIAVWHKIRSKPLFQQFARRVTRNKSLFEPKKHETEITFDDVSQEIFLWAVMACKTEISLIFWERSCSPMFLAMLGQYITSGLDEKYRDEDMSQEYRQQTETFDKLALDVLNECYETDQRKATLLLIFPHKDFNDMTLLDMAEQANNEGFVQHFIVQKLLTNLWYGNIDNETPYITILATCFLPFVAPFIFKYRKIDIQKLVHSLNAGGDYDEDCFGSDTSESEKEHESSINNISPKPIDSFHSMEAIRRSRLNSARSSGRASLPEKPKSNCLVGCVGNYFEKFFNFFQTPVIKFSYHAISHFCLLILFSYILLIQFYPNIKWFEIVLTIWIGTIILEEIRQLINGNTSSLRLLLIDYMTDVWNVMDFITITFYISGFVLRMISTDSCTLCFYSGRIMLSLSLLMYCLRVLRFLSLHPALGPFLVMIQKMLIHIFYFFDIVIVMVLAFGIAVTVIRFPNHDINYEMFLDVLLAPWFGIQQAFMSHNCNKDNLISKPPASTCAIEGLNPHDCWGRDEDCVVNEWLPSVMNAFYILLTNVMMLNLLIAMISDTYTEVSSKTELVWSMQRLQLIKEYHERPCLPPPFIFFEHIYLICRSLCPAKPPSLAQRNKFDFSIELPNLVRRDLLVWEMLQTETYLRLLQIDEGDTTESKLKETCKSVESMQLRMTKYTTRSILSVDPPPYSHLDLSFAPDFPPNLYRRFASIEKELDESKNYLILLLKRFRIKSTTRRTALTLISNFDLSGTDIGKQIKKDFIDSERKVLKEEFAKNLEQHTACRENFNYKNSIGRRVYRYRVSDFQVPWDVPYPLYRPETFTDPIVFETPMADDDLIANPSTQISFNTHDEGLRTRISMVGSYDVVGGLPLNPKGRTGLRGRGMLSRWGPNRINKAIFVRWEDRRTSGGLKRLQFLTKVENVEVDVFSIPERINAPDLLPVYECLYPLITNILNESGIRWLLENEKQVYEGYQDDPRNTDNAWLEVICRCYPEKSINTSGIDRNFEFQYSETDNYNWKRISASLQMAGSDLSLLLKVATLYGAQF